MWWEWTQRACRRLASRYAWRIRLRLFEWLRVGRIAAPLCLCVEGAAVAAATVAAAAVAASRATAADATPTVAAAKSASF